MSSARNALLFMAGQAPTSAPAATSTAAPAAPVASVPADDSDVLDVHVKKAGGGWWQLLIGAGLGVAGTVIIYKLMQPAKRESVVEKLTEA
jgi:hypothetical protein